MKGEPDDGWAPEIGCFTSMNLKPPRSHAIDKIELCLPVSVKGIVISDSEVLVVKNVRSEWELPGGKLENGETLEECVRREVEEEVGWRVTPLDVVDVWIYTVSSNEVTLVVSFGCLLDPGDDDRDLVSPEGKEVALVPLVKLSELLMPENYKRAIHRWKDLVSKQPKAID